MKSTSRRLQILDSMYSTHIGFESLFNDATIFGEKAASTYPPHNIVQISDTQYRIEIAIAGFTKEEISVKVADDTLSIKGEPLTNDTSYLYQGISTRLFDKSFQLGKGIEVKDGARFHNGLLLIDLVRDEKDRGVKEINIE